MRRYARPASLNALLPYSLTPSLPYSLPPLPPYPLTPFRPVIELTNVTRVYPMGVTEVRALNGVSLRIDEGEFVAIVGSSGSGKSTMMHVLGCLDRPTSGEYRLRGQAVSALSDRQLARVRNRNIGFVFQTFNLVSRASAWENVSLPLFYARQTRTKTSALDALQRVNLAQRADHAPNELSGGERQRVAIARAIVNRPALILADEPTGNLDTRTGDQIMAIFHRLHRAGATIVLVTHEPDIAAQADRIVTMRDGLIVEDRANGEKRYPPGFDPDAGPEGNGSASAASPADSLRPRTAEDDAAATTLAGTHAGVTVHPQAAKAAHWALTGPLCVVGMILLRLVAWLVDLKGFPAIVSSVTFLVLLAIAVASPVCGIIYGRKAARWIRMAPERFTGLGRARLAFWGSIAQVLLLGTALALISLAIAWSIRNGRFPSQRAADSAAAPVSGNHASSD